MGKQAAFPAAVSVKFSRDRQHFALTVAVPHPTQSTKSETASMKSDKGSDKGDKGS